MQDVFVGRWTTPEGGTENAIVQRRIYMDYNATAPLRPEALRAMRDALALAGNASSIHAEGRAARGVVEAARHQVAAFFNASPKCVVLTSGGTEAANLALTPHFHTGGDARPLDRLLVAAVEHPCVLQGHRFAPEAVVRLP